MKKTLIAAMALVCIAQTSYADAYYTGDNFDASSGTVNLEDVTSTFSSEAFAISFELDRSLHDIGYDPNGFFRLVLGGTPDTYQVTIASVGSVMTMGVGNNSTAAFTMNAPDTSGSFVLQIKDKGVASLWYNNNGSLEQIMEGSAPVYEVPDVIDSATLTFTGVTASNIKTWIGVVTAEDLANPTPTPSVPEPTTATLSLLALAGLAARRRRR